MWILIGSPLVGLGLVRYGPTGFDAPLLLWFRTSGDTGQLAGPEWVTALWLGLTWLGDTGPRIAAACLLVLTLLLWRRWHSALFTTGILLSGTLLSTLFKVLVERPRPQLVAHLDAVGSLSFPSGHALNSSLFYLTVALLLAPWLRANSNRHALYAVAVGLALATGVSRVALGVHWPSDVLVGWLIAAAWLWLCVVAAKRYWPQALAR